jgi:hypothetical protein
MAMPHTPYPNTPIPNTQYPKKNNDKGRSEMSERPFYSVDSHPLSEIPDKPLQIGIWIEVEFFSEAVPATVQAFGRYT